MRVSTPDKERQDTETGNQSELDRTWGSLLCIIWSACLLRQQRRALAYACYWGWTLLQATCLASSPTLLFPPPHPNHSRPIRAPELPLFWSTMSLFWLLSSACWDSTHHTRSILNVTQNVYWDDPSSQGLWSLLPGNTYELCVPEAFSKQRLRTACCVAGTPQALEWHLGSQGLHSSSICWFFGDSASGSLSSLNRLPSGSEISVISFGVVYL